MNLEKVLERIRKLLALGRRSPNPAEAETALAAAQRLLDEYNLSQADVDRRPADWVEAVVSRAKRLGPERDFLSVIVCEFFYVRVLVGVEIVDDQMFRTVSLFGRPENVAVAEYAWVFLTREFLERTKAARPRSRKSYMEGLAGSVFRRLRAERKVFGARSESTAIIQSASDLEDALSQKYPGLARRSARNYETDESSRMIGQQHGEAIELRRPLPNSAGKVSGHLPG